jgi:hypothetical protein
MLVHLFGFLDDDFLGRVIVTPSDATVTQLARQLRTWSDGLSPADACEVTDEAGNVLDPAWSVEKAGLRPGDLFTVRPLPGIER